MALNGYIKVIDSNGQWLKGDCDLLNREGWIPIFAAKHSVNFPTTVQGLPTGKHVHLPFTVCKQVDHTTARFYQFLSEGEVLQEVIIEWYKINTTTSLEEAYCESRGQVTCLQITTTIKKDLKNEK
jgi:type VI secretion system Hcp family effector